MFLPNMVGFEIAIGDKHPFENPADGSIHEKPVMT